MKPLKADLLILLVTIFWGSSYLFMKMGLDSIAEFNLIALRFGLAFILAGAIFFRRLLRIDKTTIKYAALLGFILFLVFTSITFGLKTTTTSNAGFIVSLTVVFVPLISALIWKNKIEARLTISIMLAIIGIAFLTIQLPFSITIGDFLCMAAAFFYAAHIIVVGFAAQKVDTLNLGILQLGFAGLFGLVFSFIFETPTLPGSTKGWFAILALSILCSALGFILQTVAQKYTSPERTGLIFSLEPVFAAFFGYLFAQEIMSLKEYIGAILVLLSITLSTIKKKDSAEELNVEKNNRIDCIDLTRDLEKST
ncbi:DMT family transporter [Psychrobacillus soli]|uniref:DMT family transporter n=1 Tax=Psychrobacillus soli TaxID=1543965 RepID=A0A544TKE8_9BACI|nr:DMT family transporter [Psychrobacillus soli]TQR17921.1 DMT family transporter [Psychrobacillus soli]